MYDADPPPSLLGLKTNTTAVCDQVTEQQIISAILLFENF